MTTSDKTGFTLGWSQLTQNQKKILKKEIMDLLEIKSDTGFSFVKSGTTRLNKAEKICCYEYVPLRNKYSGDNEDHRTLKHQESACLY